MERKIIETEKGNTINPFNRRNFLKSGVMIGATFCIPSGFANVVTAETKNSSQKNNAMNNNVKSRTLGYGDSSFTVSALGLGCMGMNYHRGQVPDRKVMIKTIASGS